MNIIIIIIIIIIIYYYKWWLKNKLLWVEKQFKSQTVLLIAAAFFRFSLDAISSSLFF